MLKVEEIARKPECVGILSGLNLGRELATHFAQESLLKTSCKLCEKLLLPLVLHITDSSLEICIEILKGENWCSNLLSVEEGSLGAKNVLLHDAVTACGG